MTIALLFFGGPRDGRFERTSDQEFDTSSPVIHREKRGYYTSIDPWDGTSNRITLEWFWGTPEFHEQMKAETEEDNDAD